MEDRPYLLRVFSESLIALGDVFDSLPIDDDIFDVRNLGSLPLPRW